MEIRKDPNIDTLAQFFEKNVQKEQGPEQMFYSEVAQVLFFQNKLHMQRLKELEEKPFVVQRALLLKMAFDLAEEKNPEDLCYFTQELFTLAQKCVNSTAHFKSFSVAYEVFLKQLAHELFLKQIADDRNRTCT